jgi:hypothetical protein
MSPSKKDRSRARSRDASKGTPPAAADWALAFYMTKDGRVPAREFLSDCPGPVREMLLAILVAVRDAPPPSFPPSGMWHAMHGEMKGIYEARDAHDGQLYRVFCILDSQASEHGLDAKVIVLVCGGAKRVRSVMDDSVYREALRYRTDYLATRRIALPMGIQASRRKT